MKAALDDNAKGALHFLMMSGGLLALLGVGLAIAERALAGDAMLEEAMRPWRMGYLLHRPDAFVLATTERIERLALTLVMGIVGGCGIGGSGWLLFRSMPVALRMGRTGGATVLLVLAWSGLACPPRTTWPDAGTQDWVLRERLALPGGFGVPFTAREERIPFTSVLGITEDSLPVSAPCGMEGRLVLLLQQGEQVLAAKRPSGRSCSEALHAVQVQARSTISVLAERAPASVGLRHTR